MTGATEEGGEVGTNGVSEKRKPTKISYHYMVNGYRRVIYARNQKDADRKAEKLWGAGAIPITGKSSS